MRCVFSPSPDARETSRGFIVKLDLAIDDLTYQYDVFASEEQRIANRVKKLVQDGKLEQARADCVQIATLRRQAQVISRYMGVLHESKATLAIVSAMDTVQNTMRATDALMQQVNARFRGTLADCGIKAHAAEMDENRKKIEEAVNVIFAGEATKPELVLAEFAGKTDTSVSANDPDMEALKNFKV